jgi:hypothetical protein
MNEQTMNDERCRQHLWDSLSVSTKCSDVDLLTNGRLVNGASLVLVSALLLACPSLARSQSESPSVALTVATGRQLDIVVDQRVVIKRVGKPINGMIVQPVYAYDRVVVPASTSDGTYCRPDGPLKITDCERSCLVICHHHAPFTFSSTHSSWRLVGAPLPRCCHERNSTHEARVGTAVDDEIPRRRWVA